MNHGMMALTRHGPRSHQGCRNPATELTRNHNGKCSYCGEEQHHGDRDERRSACPASNHICTACHCMGHYDPMCRGGCKKTLRTWDPDTGLRRHSCNLNKRYREGGESYGRGRSYGPWIKTEVITDYQAPGRENVKPAIP